MFRNALLSLAVALNATVAFAGFVIHNEDCTQFFIETNYSADEAGARKWLSRYTDAGKENLRIVMLNPQGQMASYESKVLRTAWSVLDRSEDGVWSYKGKSLGERSSKMYDRMRAMQTAGIDKDVYTIWIKQCREVGVSPWISVRLNDVHGADDDDGYMMCDLWKQHHEFWLNTYYGKNWFSRQLDYAHPEVRKLYLDVISELLERYDGDGIELDFMRFGQVLRYGHEYDDAHFVTEFVREARRRCNDKAAKVGHKVGLAVRVPADPRDAVGRGFDVETWLDEGLVDIVTPTPFFQTNWDDLPVHIWKKIIRGRALLVPGIEAGFAPPGLPRQSYDIGFRYALADIYYARGADGIYTFNHFGNNVELYRIFADPARVAAQARRALLTYSDTRQAGMQRGAPLPDTIGGGFSQFRLSLGTRPEPGRTARLLIASKSDIPADKLPEVYLNGVRLQGAVVAGNLGYDVFKRLVGYPIPEGTLTTEGNVIDIRYTHGGTIELNWMEIDVSAK